MLEDNKHIDQQIKQKLEGFSMTPPDDAWAAIAPNISKKRGGFFWFLIALTGIMLIGTATYLLYPKNDLDSTQSTLTSLNDHEKEIGDGIIQEITTNSISSDSNDTESSSEIHTSVENTGNLEGQNNRNQDHQTSTNGRQASSSSSNNGRSSTGTNHSGNRGNSNTSSSAGTGNIPTDNTASMNNSNRTSGKRNIPSGNLTSGNNSSTGIGNGNIPTDNTASTNNSNRTSGRGNIPSGNLTSGSNSNTGTGTIPTDNTAAGSNNNNSGRSNSSSLFTDPSITTSVQNDSDKNNDQMDFLPLKPITTSLIGLDNVIPNYVPQRNLNPFKDRFSLDLSMGAQTFRVATRNITDPTLQQQIKDAHSNHEGFDFQANVNINLAGDFSVYTGANYTSLKNQIIQNTAETQTFFTIDSIGIVIDTATMDTTEVIYQTPYDSTVLVSNTESVSYKMLTIPFGISWNMDLRPRSSLAFSLGGTFSVYGKYSGNIVNSETGIGAPANDIYKKTGVLSFGGSVKYLYHVLPKHSLYIEPWFQMGVSNLNLAAPSSAIPLDQRLHKGGIRVGYRFQF